MLCSGCFLPLQQQNAVPLAIFYLLGLLAIYGLKVIVIADSYLCHQRHCKCTVQRCFCLFSAGKQDAALHDQGNYMLNAL